MVRLDHNADQQEPILLTVPALNGTGPSPWHSLWEESRRDTQRVVLGHWSKPRREAWIKCVDRAVKESPSPVFLCAHSLGCLAVASWADRLGRHDEHKVAGAFLIAPPDLTRPSFGGKFNDFSPVPRSPLPFPSVVVVSEENAWTGLAEAKDIASAWGSLFVTAPASGRAVMNANWWDEGQRLIEKAVLAAGARHHRSEAKSIIAVNATEAVWADLLGLT